MVKAAASKIIALSPAGSLQEVFEQCRRLGMRLSRQRRMVLDLLWQLFGQSTNGPSTPLHRWQLMPPAP